ncbi:hypothetical protein [Sphingobium sp.]|uniref:hypothetical protein n=1 Tax=Sphingobium sp. TaxID=1912891 RepID=UPI0028BEC6C7|nr:hypothetical protein [Sphingobium sp.]
MYTPIAIMGVGPAGVFPVHLRYKAGIDAVALEQINVNLMHELRVSERFDQLGLVHGGTNLSIVVLKTCSGDW